MSYQAKGWAWAAAGVLTVLMVAWMAISIYAFFDNLSNANRITKIEKRVIGVGKSKTVRRPNQSKSVQGFGTEGGDAPQPAQHAGQQPTPAPAGGQGGQDHGGGHKQTPRNPPSPTPAPAPMPPGKSDEAPGRASETPSNPSQPDLPSPSANACVDVAVNACVGVNIGTP